MSEDDTFNKLRRCPLKDVIEFYHLLACNLIDYEKFIEKISERGWNWTEFEKEYILK